MSKVRRAKRGKSEKLMKRRTVIDQNKKTKCQQKVLAGMGVRKGKRKKVHTKSGSRYGRDGIDREEVGKIQKCQLLDTNVQFWKK